MADLDLDTTISNMLAPAQQRLGQLGSAINGAGAEAAAAYKNMTSRASAQVDLARQAAQSIGAFKADETLPSGHRLTESIERTAATRTMLRKLNEGAQEAHGQLASALTTAALPKPHHEAAERLLVRDSLRTRYGHLDGDRLVAEVTKRLGQDAAHDGEILSSFGDSFFAGKGINDDQVHAIRTQATEAYLKSTTGTKQQLAARKAMTTMRELNTVGHLAAYTQAANLHLSKLDLGPEATALAARGGDANGS